MAWDQTFAIFTGWGWKTCYFHGGNLINFQVRNSPQKKNTKDLSSGFITILHLWRMEDHQGPTTCEFWVPHKRLKFLSISYVYPLLYFRFKNSFYLYVCLSDGDSFKPAENLRMQPSAHYLQSRSGHWSSVMKPSCGGFLTSVIAGEMEIEAKASLKAWREETVWVFAWHLDLTVVLSEAQQLRWPKEADV